MSQRLKINPTLFFIRIFYFLTAGGCAAINPYLPLFAKQLGFNKAEIGIIYGTFPFVIIFSTIFIGVVADKTSRYKLILISLLLLKAFSLFPMYYLPPLANEKTQNIIIYCKNDEIHLNNYLWNSTISDQFQIFCNFTCQMTFLNFNNSLYHNLSSQSTEFIFNLDHSLFFSPNLKPIVENSSLNKCQISDTLQCKMTSCNHSLIFVDEAEEKIVHFTYQLLIFLVLRVITEVALVGSANLGDAMVLDQLKEDSLQYGKFRVMGSIGYGTFCMIFGYAFDVYSEGKPKIDYLIGFYLSSGFFALNAIIVAIFFKADIPTKNHHLFQDMKQILSVPKTLLFLFFVLVNGVLHNFFETYFLWFLNDIGGSHALSGWAIFASCATEIPFFLFSGKLIKWLGSNNIMYLIFITWGIRIVLYTVIKVPWGLIPVELLHGITFALFYANMAANVKESSLPGMLATNQQIHFSVFGGIGGIFGNMFGGFAYEKYGAIATFQVLAWTAFSSAVIYFIINTSIFCVQKRKEKSLDEIDLWNSAS